MGLGTVIRCPELVESRRGLLVAFAVFYEAHWGYF
jgi:hypothetical protein